MEQKIENAKKYFFIEGKTTLNDIQSYANAQIPGLMQSIGKEQSQVVGPMEFIYFGATNDMNNIFTLQIAMPVAEKKTVAAPYEIRETSPFVCESFIYEGSLVDIGPAYDNAFAQIGAKQLIPTGEIREIYHHYKDYTSAENRTEIQIGVQA